MSRLTIDISGDQHQQIKALAAMQGKSIKEYVLERLFPGDASDLEQDAWEELKALLQERIASAEGGAVSTKTVAQITEEALTTESKC
jgi:hypothetical protein